ncbi:MAG TPA: hypothetical protein VGN08_13630 [Solirubrobacteraceae bacterium]|jgi:hypothetical protein
MTLELPPGSDRLPPGRHKATTGEIKTVLVDGFPGSITRRQLFDRWVLVRQAIGRVVPITAEWLNGSFVTSKEDPGDIDVVTHLDAAAYERLDAVDRVTLAGLLGGRRSRPLHGCDSFPLVAYPAGHPGAAMYTLTAQYWENLWGTHRDGDPKGFIEVVDVV